jgi:hypothetical protein
MSSPVGAREASHIQRYQLGGCIARHRASAPAQLVPYTIIDFQRLHTGRRAPQPPLRCIDNPGLIALCIPLLERRIGLLAPFIHAWLSGHLCHEPVTRQVPCECAKRLRRSAAYQRQDSA